MSMSVAVEDAAASIGSPARKQTEAPAALRFYRPELDGLRFFAFLAVYVNHTLTFGISGHHHRLPDRVAHALGTLGESGAFGVDLFFVLIAYLITELLLRERRTRGNFDIPAFYARRVLRIWPLYFAFLALAFALPWIVPSEQLSWRHLLGFLFFAGNWVYMLHPVTTVAAPLWSVSVEEQFYLAWPWAIRGGGLRRILMLALAVTALGMALRLALGLGHLTGDFVSKNSLTRVDGLVAGIVLAVCLRGRVPRLPASARRWLLLGCLGLMLWVAHSFDLLDGPVLPIHLMLGWPLVAVACAGVLLAVLGDQSSFLRSAPLVYLGRISYGLYVFHQLGLLIASRVFPLHATLASHWVGRCVLALLLTVPMAAASYRWLEQPFLRLKRRRFSAVRTDPVSA